MYYKTYYDSPVGKLTLYSDKDSIIEIRFPKDGHEFIKASEKTIEKDDLKVFKEIKIWLDKYFNGENPKIDNLPLKFIGSTFQIRVMKELCKIPYGEISTYKDIARRISPTMSAQAIGNVLSYNPLCIVVPCHRVIGANNNLVGFGAGLDTKKWLLKHEGVDISKLITPKKGNAL